MVSSSIGDRVCFIRRPCFGVNTTAACGARVCTWRRSRWKYCAAVVALHDLDVVLGGQGEEALDAGRGVLGALALVAVRQQQHEAVVLAPLVLGGDEVLVDDDLGAVDEVAELRLPHHQRVVVGVRVAVLEAERGVLATAASRRPRSWPRRPSSSSSGIHGFAGLVVDERGVALAERAAAGVLAGEPDRWPSSTQRAERQRLGRRPVDLAVVLVQLRARPRTAWPAWGGR